MQNILAKLYHRQNLTQNESEYLFNAIINDQIEPLQLTAVLIAMKIRGETIEEIIGAVSAFLHNTKPFPSPDYIFADIVGTGGDNNDLINISTASAFVAAACGFKIAKHGNRSISSKSGSFDLLEAFGINLFMTAKQSRQTLDELNICFLFAPQYHMGFRNAITVRNQLKTRTIFNILGPLINPARPPLILIGVYSSRLIYPVAQTLKKLGYQRAAVVHGSGVDEVVLHGPTQVAELKNGEIINYQLTKEDFGFHFYDGAFFNGSTPEKNRDILSNVLQGKGKYAYEQSIAVNVALLMKLFGNEDLRDNVQRALAVIRSGEAYELIIAFAARK
ncbi:anthranilate phosphoribosyltransferase [Pantoea sp. Aalb]|uniref:anthranilate phosphoribosyltransferase n=1 Tax=Pantoea sp. Aalb TaxID=2576762 RepID=UPI00132C7647|nr:anthranilate phosphoribosyltransferase [Pantoea sp. Aalb]MXP67392.1 anthranilate phosphoribosyltransferase [Pantoea sp. Aalb]